MAAEPQQASLSAVFPAPPSFYKSFTPENLERLQDLSQPQDQAAAALPPELRNLVPPSPPADGRYRSFGANYDITPTQSKQTIPTRAALLALSDRLLQLYLRYVQILATDPSGLLWVPQWEEIRNTFEKIHGIINEYRPHQARESLVLMMEDQIQQLKKETKRVQSTVGKAEELMEKLGSENRSRPAGDHDPRSKLNGQGVGSQGSAQLSGNIDQNLWNMLEKEVGDS